VILQESSGKLIRVGRSDFATEKELQTLVEQNLAEVFGCRLVATEFSTGKITVGESTHSPCLKTATR